MAKPKTPLLSLGARGTIADSITYQKRGTGTIAREKPIPRQPDTDRQLWHRYLYRQATQYWQTLTPTQKQVWESDARPYHMTGFAYFMRFELNRLANLMLCLPLDEGRGSIAYDYSGNLNHGTLFGPSWAPGIIGDCLSFDGVDDYVNCGDSPSLRLQEMTLECWIYLDQIPLIALNRHNFFSKDSAYDFVYYENPLALTFILREGVVWTVTSTGITLLASQWYHLLLTYDMAVFTLYVDGIQRFTTPLTVVPNQNANPLYLGWMSRAGPIRFLDGLMDEPRAYNVALTTNEITRHANRR